MQNDSPLILVEVTAKFKRNLRILAKKYRSIRNDIQPIIEQLEVGELPGDQISGVGYTIFKLRVKNSDVQKGKTGGYRLIYYVKTSTKIILVTIYSKSEQEDIVAAEIQQLLDQLEQTNQTTTEAQLIVDQAVERQPLLQNSQIVEQAIKNTPPLKVRLRSAGKAAYLETVKVLLPPVGIAIEAVKAWKEPEA